MYVISPLLYWDLMLASIWKSSGNTIDSLACASSMVLVEVQVVVVHDHFDTVATCMHT